MGIKSFSEVLVYCNVHCRHKCHQGHTKCIDSLSFPQPKLGVSFFAMNYLYFDYYPYNLWFDIAIAQTEAAAELFIFHTCTKSPD